MRVLCIISVKFNLNLRVKWSNLQTVLLLMVYQRYIKFRYMILTKICKIQHCWYQKICRFIVPYIVAACFKGLLVSAPWWWRDNSAETSRTYVKDFAHKLQNSVHLLVLHELCVSHIIQIVRKYTNSHNSCYVCECNTNKCLLHIFKKSTVFVLVGHRAHDVGIREYTGTDNSREVAPGKRIGSR
jgi:hypothetical protein